MSTERPVPQRFGIRIEPGPSQVVETTWDQESIEAVITHFSPVFEQTRPLAVYIRLGEGLEIEHEDLSLLMDAEKRKKLPTLTVLHMVTFLAEVDEFDSANKYYGAEYDWGRNRAKKEQHLHVHPYPIPFPTSSELVDTLEKALQHFHISALDYEQVYPVLNKSNHESK